MEPAKAISFPLLSEALAKAGAAAIAAVRAEVVSDTDRTLFESWLAEGMNADMAYMHNWPDLRFDPQAMHEGTRWIICCAFPYAQNLQEAPHIASYALGDDYHKVIPKRIREALRTLENEFSATARICTDSAPVRERYWAIRSGLAHPGDSGLVAIPGLGTQFFLAEILTPYDLITSPTPQPQPPHPSPTSKSLSSDTSEARVPNLQESPDTCTHCGACKRACPGGAITGDGRVDARKCVSYLTIEHKGEWTDEQKQIMSSPKAKGRLFGCEICQRVRPLNRQVPTTTIPEFQPRPTLLTLTPAQAVALTPEDFATLTRNTPLKRTGLPALHRNATPHLPPS